MTGTHAARSVLECGSPLPLSQGKCGVCISVVEPAGGWSVRTSTSAPEGWRTPRRFAKFGALILAWLVVIPLFVQAHAPDTSYLRAVVSKHALELRFTFDIATLHRIERLDADNDGKVTRAEAEKVAPEIAEFLRQSITLEVNGTKAELGAVQPLGWPVDAGESVEEKNYGQTLVHFTFKQDFPQKVIEDFYVLYEVFAQLGAVHRAVANVEQEDKHMEVVFNQFEPDYLYDTYWRPEENRAEEVEPPLDRKGNFCRGVAGVWGLWWLPILLLFGYATTLKWTNDRCYKWLLGLAFWFWLFAFGADSNPTPERGAVTVGAVAGWWLMAFVMWPIRSVARDFWKIGTSGARSGTP